MSHRPNGSRKPLVRDYAIREPIQQFKRAVKRSFLDRWRAVDEQRSSNDFAKNRVSKKSYIPLAPRSNRLVWHRFRSWSATECEKIIFTRTSVTRIYVYFVSVCSQYRITITIYDRRRTRGFRIGSWIDRATVLKANSENLTGTVVFDQFQLARFPFLFLSYEHFMCLHDQ